MAHPHFEPIHFRQFGERVREAGSRLLPSPIDYPVVLNQELLRLALLTGGKLVRPSITVGVATVLRDASLCTYAFAWACELLHTSSLILDDLPSMDNAHLRRGEPCVHVRRGEAFALFTALHAHNTAMAMIQAYASSPAVGMAFFQATFDALGSTGLIGGQYLDIDLRTEGADLSHHEAYRLKRGFPTLWMMCNHFKTASLFRLSLLAAGISLELDQDRLDSLGRVGDLLGLAFQLRDDTSDVGEDNDATSLLKGLISPEQCAHEVQQLRQEYRNELELAFSLKGLRIASLMDSVFEESPT